MGHMRRPMLLRHLGQQLQHLVVADAKLTDLAALAGAPAASSPEYEHLRCTCTRLSHAACNVSGWDAHSHHHSVCP